MGKVFMWHKAKGKRLEVTADMGKYVCCRFDGETKIHRYHRESLVQQECQTTPAKHKARKELTASRIKEKRSHRRPCPNCGGIMTATAMACNECWKKFGKSTAPKTCECGKRMNWKSKMCSACMRSKKGNHGSVGEDYLGLVQITDAEALLLREPANRREEELADQVIARKCREIRAARLATGIIHQEEGGRTEVMGVMHTRSNSVPCTPGSDRHRRGF